jgi:hypothetical protein
MTTQHDDYYTGSVAFLDYMLLPESSGVYEVWSAPNPSERFVLMADDLAYMIINEKQSWEDVLTAARKYLKARGN